MSAIAFGLLLKPFACVVFFAPGVLAVALVKTYLRDGWLKRFLLINWKV